MSKQVEMWLDEPSRELPPLELDLSGWHAVKDEIRRQLDLRKSNGEAHAE